MDAELLIKARKVFVTDTIVENTETCPHCASKDLDNKLRYFYLSLEEAIYKCANPACFYPFERFTFKSLVDNSVYYYEEVIDGGREAFLRVPLEGQSLYQSQNPFSTKLFCDSQRNPDIENYDMDFSDLFNEDDTNPPKTVEENEDFLEFLNETAPVAETNKQLDEAGIDSFIENLLNESPVMQQLSATPLKVSPKMTKATAEATKPRSKPKTEAKLSKCLKHIEKTKNSRSQKNRENSSQMFTTAIKNARQSRNKAPTDEKVTTVVPSTVTSSKTSNSVASAAKVLQSANSLRPTALATSLLSLDKTSINSNFLRQYMKVKEERKSSDGPNDTKNSKSEAGNIPRCYVKLPFLDNLPNTVDVEPKKDDVKKEHEPEVKKEPQGRKTSTKRLNPAALKRLAAVKEDKYGDSSESSEAKTELTVGTNRKSPRKRPSKKNDSDGPASKAAKSPVETEKHSKTKMSRATAVNNDGIEIKKEKPAPKRRSRKEERDSTLQPKQSPKKVSDKAKRQRKTEKDLDKTEHYSLSLLLETIENVARGYQTPSESMDTCDEANIFSVSDLDSETSSEPWFGFSSFQTRDTDEKSTLMLSKLLNETHQMPEPRVKSENSCVDNEAHVSVSLEESAMPSANNTAQSYYLRKNFKQEKETEFQLDKIIDDWDDSRSEHVENRTKGSGKPAKGMAYQDDDTATVISVISDMSSCSSVCLLEP